MVLSLELVLGMSGLEFISHVAAHMVLCYRLVTRTVLKRQRFIIVTEQCLNNMKVLCTSRCTSQPAEGKQETGVGHSWQS